MSADPSPNATSHPGEKESVRRPRWRLLATAGATGLAITAALVFVGFALSGGLDKTTSEQVRGPGTQVVRVALVDAVVGFDVTPDLLKVARGTHVVLKVVNEGDEDHDLAVQGGAKTRMLGPGDSDRLDLGTVTDDLDLWCTLPGHKLGGMTLDVQIVDPPAIEKAATR
jgi:nitrite reductase (NO-forming)